MKVGIRQAVSGVEASRYFDAIRNQILGDLEANRNDRSLAGRVDPLVLPLVSFINSSFEQYVTSSSCSGRISLFHKGKVEGDHALTNEPWLRERKRGAFGRGALFQSHDFLPDIELTVRESLIPILTEFAEWRAGQLITPTTVATELLQLKYEPMILHIICKDIEAAASLLQCASEAAQTNSGIVSCSKGTPESRKITCCITSPLIVDIPLLSHGSWALGSTVFTNEAWMGLLRHTLGHMNRLAAENLRRMHLLQEKMQVRLLAGGH